MNLANLIAEAKTPHSPINWMRIEQAFWVEHCPAIKVKLSPEMREHLWEDGVGLAIWQIKELPSAERLAEDMFDEWDDPVSEEDAGEFLKILQEVAG